MKSTEVLNPRHGFITRALIDKLDDLAIRIVRTRIHVHVHRLHTRVRYIHVRHHIRKIACARKWLT